MPVVPLIKKMSTPSVMLANRTVRPTLSCDHRSCFWLGTHSSPGRECRPAQPFDRHRHGRAHGSNWPDHSRPVRRLAVQLRGVASVGNRPKASRYATAPHARVTFRPKWMAITMASTDPRTLDAAFMAQAHSTELSGAFM